MGRQDKERQDSNLTQRGWKEGSFYGDALGGKIIVDIPEDRILTISCYDKKPSPFSEPFFHDNISWACDDKKKLTALTEKYGDKLDWFVYNHMNNSYLSSYQKKGLRNGTQ